MDHLLFRNSASKSLQEFFLILDDSTLFCSILNIIVEYHQFQSRLVMFQLILIPHMHASHINTLFILMNPIQVISYHYQILLANRIIHVY